MLSSSLCAASEQWPSEQSPAPRAPGGAHCSESNLSLGWRKGPKMCNKNSWLKCRSATHQLGGLGFLIGSTGITTQVSRVRQRIPQRAHCQPPSANSTGGICLWCAEVLVSRAVQKVSNSQWMPKTGLKFPSKSSTSTINK